MENKYLIDLSVKYGLNNVELEKLSGLMYQVGITDGDSEIFKKVTAYICENKLLERPEEELIEELKLKGLIPA